MLLSAIRLHHGAFSTWLARAPRMRPWPRDRKPWSWRAGVVSCAPFSSWPALLQNRNTTIYHKCRSTALKNQDRAKLNLSKYYANIILQSHSTLRVDSPLRHFKSSAIKTIVVQPCDESFELHVVLCVSIVAQRVHEAEQMRIEGDAAALNEKRVLVVAPRPQRGRRPLSK